MAYGSLKVDNIIFTNGGVDQTITVSGIVAATSGNLTVTGTISGAVVRGGTLVSGATVTGGAGQFTTLTGGTAGFTTVTGTTVTGTTANFVSGVFTTQISGATVTGNAGQFTNIAAGGIGATTITGTTVTGTTANFASGVFTTQISGATVTGTTANFTSGNFTSISGGTQTVTSGVFASGTAALPSISFASDPNTGIYSPGADQVAISTNGSQRLSIGATGSVDISSTIYVDAPNFRVGLGVVSPSEKLDVAGSINLSNVNTFIKGGGHNVIQVDATRTYVYGGTDGIQFRTADNTSALIDITNTGLVGLGTSSPAAGLDVQAGTWSDHLIKVGTSTQAGRIGFRRGTDGVLAGNIGWSSATDDTTFIVENTGGDSVVRLSAPASVNFFTGSGTPVERARIDSSGRLLVGTSTATANGGVLELSGGITFPATAVAATDPNTLDDYEEGTWTPNITGGYNSNNTVTYTTQSGSYTKIGRLVVAAFHIEINTWSGNAGPVFFAGLPFTPATTTDARFQGTAYLSGPDTPASTVSVNIGYGRADNGTYYLVFNCIRDDTAMANAGMLVGGNFAANDIVAGTFTYFV